MYRPSTYRPSVSGNIEFDTHPCSVCGDLLSQFVHETCSTCEFVNECLSKAESHCAVIQIARYQLFHLPEALSRFRARGWDVVVKPRAWLARAFGSDDLDLELRARSVASCRGRPAPRHEQVSPTPCMVRNAKHQQCNSCTFRNSPMLTGRHENLLLRCAVATASYDNEAVKVRCSNAELALLIPVIDELQTRGWNVSIDCWKPWQSATISIEPPLFTKSAKCDCHEKCA
jgi:hypothetical protein